MSLEPPSCAEGGAEGAGSEAEGAEGAEGGAEGVEGGAEEEAGIRFTREITGGREADESEEGAGSAPPAFFLLRVRLSFLDSPE